MFLGLEILLKSPKSTERRSGGRARGWEGGLELRDNTICEKGRCLIAAASSNIKSHFQKFQDRFIVLFFSIYHTLTPERERERAAEHVLC